jgi:hypothetical protein
MKKKDPVLWVVVDKKSNSVWSSWLTMRSRRAANALAKQLGHTQFGYAPFRVVKYLPAQPKKRKNAK